MAGDTLIWLAWWDHADWVVKGVFVTLVTLSLVSWTVIVYKMLMFSYLLWVENNVARTIGTDRDVAEALQTASSKMLAERLILSGAARNEHAVQDGLVKLRLELESYLTMLATIGNSAPFIGLLGTVWGIMRALQSMDSSAGLTLETVSGPVGEALVATAMGLFAAIPAVMGYNLLLRRLRKLHMVMTLNVRLLLEAGPVKHATEVTA